MRVCVPPPPLPQGPDGVEELALYLPSRWPDDVRTIHVRFLDGHWSVWRRVALSIAGPGGWNRACGMQFVFDQAADAPVRVTFETGPSWAYEGIGCTYVPLDQPTMQLGWLKESTSDKEVRRVSLHEFGHILGFPHEHRLPEPSIPWDKEAVYAYYARVSGWDRLTVDEQVLTPIAPSVLDVYGYDPQSIMHYWIDPAFVLDHVERGGATVLSPMDVAAARYWYGPPPALPEPPPVSPPTPEPPPEPTTDWRVFIPVGRRAESP